MILTPDDLRPSGIRLIALVSKQEALRRMSTLKQVDRQKLVVFKDSDENSSSDDDSDMTDNSDVEENIIQ